MHLPRETTVEGRSGRTFETMSAGDRTMNRRRTAIVRGLLTNTRYFGGRYRRAFARPPAWPLIDGRR